MLVNFYYSVRVLADGDYTGDDELLQLCRPCARKHAADVQWASRGDEESECEFCGAANDLERKAHLDAIFAQYVQG